MHMSPKLSSKISTLLGKYNKEIYKCNNTNMFKENRERDSFE